MDYIKLAGASMKPFFLSSSFCLGLWEAPEMGRAQPSALSLHLNWGNKNQSHHKGDRKHQQDSRDKGTLLGKLFTVTASTSASYLALLRH